MSEFSWPVRVYYEDTDTCVLGVWTCERRNDDLWTLVCGVRERRGISE